MKKWQIENSEKSEISEISEKLLRVFLFPSFRFCPSAKIENRIWNSWEKMSEISEFSTWSKKFVLFTDQKQPLKCTQERK